ncbi:glycosyltransferase family 4 protein [Phenylobacterium sp.]|uniref:glycosyltransferase family 4 protein n=1 Tax=Phenylobacterium sp. TaxID=1871053 RepID=UPI0035ADD570
MVRAALSFTPDTYHAGQAALGRRVANTAFLRAAVAGRGGGEVVGYGYEAGHAGAFAEAVRAIDPAAPARWLLTTDAEELAAQGAVHRMDPAIQAEVAARAWVGLGRYSITAVAHTVFNRLPELALLAREPLMPWDALVCTSHSLRAAVAAVLEAELEYARWRYGTEAAPSLPQLPVIPLGVHCEDHLRPDAARAAARSALAVGEDEVAALFVGRLSLMSKAHPGQMYQGLEVAAARTGRRLVLIECGWPKTDNDRLAFERGGALLAPGVRRLRVDGNDPLSRADAWNAADLFISLSDNIQETFGLTPLEAMAAGLPVVASDWDGYRDTVRDGVDGFLIPTWAPAPGLGAHLAYAHQARTITDDTLSWGAAAATSVDPERLVRALSELVVSEELRRRMGAAGQARARAEFDWARVYGRYVELWGELDARRRRDGAGLQAVRPGAQLDPFTAFAAYPTHAFGPQTRVALRPGATLAAYRALADHPLFPSGAAAQATAAPLWGLLEGGATTLEAAAAALGRPVRSVALAAGVLAKMGFLAFEPDA